MKDSVFLHSSLVGFAIPSTYSLIAGGVVILSTIALIPRNDYAGPRLTLTGPGISEAPRTAKPCFQDQARQIPGNGHDVPRSKVAPRNGMLLGIASQG
jgi:hypothetical protein